MKLTTIIKNPKNIFRSKKSHSGCRSNTPSFSSGTTSSSSDSSHHKTSRPDPTSVLPTRSREITSGEWSEISSDVSCEVVKAFNVIDRDGDGKITRAQLVALLSQVGPQPPTEEELTKMLSEVDREGDGCISLEEFGAISSAFGPPTCNSELRETFDFFDTDHDGKITAEELLRVFSSIGDERCTLEDCRCMINGVDKNGDGFVCFEDFTRMMEQQT